MVNQLKNGRGGFTIIEILVGIVVIGILVGIVTVSFTSITKQTRQAALENALIDTAGKVRAYKNQNGTYPTSIDDIETSNNPDIELALTRGDDKIFCVSVLGVTGTKLHITINTNAIQEGGCPIPPLQSYTKTSCPSTRTLAVDARDNHTYWIQKLADNQCWMLTNLAYAGGTDNGGTNQYNDVINQGTGAPGTNTINGPDNSGAVTYTLAKYYTHAGANPTTDPTPPSTDATGGGSGAGRQYGYLYNWCAAMGGQDTAACANATTPAPIPTTNICPAGWRLPTGEPTTGEFTALNTAINGGKTNTDAGLIASPGLFQRSGNWNNGFYNQGSIGLYWSSIQSSATNARNLYFSSTNVGPANNNGKSYGRAVRCVAE